MNTQPIIKSLQLQTEYIYESVCRLAPREGLCRIIVLVGPPGVGRFPSVLSFAFSKITIIYTVLKKRVEAAIISTIPAAI